MTEINSLLSYQGVKEEYQRAKAPLHIHPIGREGASDCYIKCTHLKCLKKAGFKLPPLTGVKAQMSEIGEEGDIFHTEIQMTLHEQYDDDPDVQFDHELYVEMEIVPGITGVSPIDLAYFHRPTPGDPPNIELREIRFKDGPRLCKCISAAGMRNLFQIGDIKTMSDWKFEQLTKYGQLDPGYYGQFDFYMLTVNHVRLELFAVRRSDNAKDRRWIEYNEPVWQEVKKKNANYLTLIPHYLAMLKDGKTYDQFPRLVESVYGCCAGDGIPWWSCPLSDTVMTEIRGKQTQKLIAPCPPATYYIEKKAVAKFEPNTIWHKTASQIVYIKQQVNNVVIVESIVKGTGTEYQLGLVEAFYDLEPATVPELITKQTEGATIPPGVEAKYGIPHVEPVKKPRKASKKQDAAQTSLDKSKPADDAPKDTIPFDNQDDPIV